MAMINCRFDRSRSNGSLTQALGVIAMLASLHIIMAGITPMNAQLAFAAPDASFIPTSFCNPKSFVVRQYSTIPCRRVRVLNASIVPESPGRVDAVSNAGESIENEQHNVMFQGGHNNIAPPAKLDEAPQNVDDMKDDSVTPETNISLESNKIVQVQQGDQLIQTRQLNDNIAIAGIAAFLSLAVGAVIKYSPPGCWRYYLAGGICASTSHAITTPIDVVKTRQQVDPMLQEKSMWQATLEIMKVGGPFALLAGLGPTFIGYLIEGGVKFGIYEVSKPATQRFVASIASLFSNPALDSRIITLILCGFISGSAASLMLSPMEALRIRMVSDEEFFEKNLVDAGATMMRKEGIQSLLKGLPAMFWKQVPYTITKNASFDLFTTWLYSAWRAMGYAVTANVQFAIPLLSALAAAVLSCISSHPGDILLSLVNAHEGSKRTRDFAREIRNGKDGISGFFVGIKPRFLHVLMIVTVQLMIYDFVKRLVGIPATGMG